MKRMIFVIFLLLTWNPAVEAQAPFYQGKTITFITGSPAGDLFDLYVRTVGQFMVKHIPGNPDVIVQNMPGAGHMIAANYVYNIAKPDGLTLIGTLATLYIDQLVGQPEVKYD
jgi:tripartite-type tricarboxylate transporter receptor subunit TctC